MHARAGGPNCGRALTRKLGSSPCARITRAHARARAHAGRRQRHGRVYVLKRVGSGTYLTTPWRSSIVLASCRQVPHNAAKYRPHETFSTQNAACCQAWPSVRDSAGVYAQLLCGSAMGGPSNTRQALYACTSSCRDSQSRGRDTVAP